MVACYEGPLLDVDGMETADSDQMAVLQQLAGCRYRAWDTAG